MSPTTAPIGRRRSSTTSSTSRSREPMTRLAPLAGRSIRCRCSSIGNPDLTEASLDAYEVGYTGILPGASVVSAAVYVNKTKNDIFFTEVKSARWTAANPPPRWPLPPAVITLGHRRCRLPGAVHLPELRRDHAEGHSSSGIDTPLVRHVEPVRELLVSGDTGAGGFRHLGAEPAGEEPLQRRRQFRLQPAARQPLGQLLRRRLLAGRARRSVSWHDRAVHAGQRRLRREVGRQGPPDHHDQGHQPGQPGRPAARVRRHHQAPGGGRARVQF